MADAKFKVICSSTLSPLENKKRKLVLIKQEAILYDIHFLVQDKLTGKALVNIPYKITLENGKCVKGKTDANGLTEKISGNSSNIATLEAPYYGDNPSGTGNTFDHNNSTCSC